jgi:hypothetical protein
MIKLTHAKSATAFYLDPRLVRFIEHGKNGGSHVETGIHSFDVTEEPFEIIKTMGAPTDENKYVDLLRKSEERAAIAALDRRDGPARDDINRLFKFLVNECGAPTDVVPAVNMAIDLIRAQDATIQAQTKAHDDLQKRFAHLQALVDGTSEEAVLRRATGVSVCMHPCDRGLVEKLEVMRKSSVPGDGC